jgi:hypothetical protein
MAKLFKLGTAILAIVLCCGLAPDLCRNHSEDSAVIRDVQSSSQIIRDDYITTTGVKRFAVEPGAANFFGGKTRDRCRVAITRRVVKNVFGQPAGTPRG